MEQESAPKTNKLVVVLGMHRTGTSLITRSLQTLGIELGNNLMPPVEGNNAKGFFEDLEINKICNLALAEQDLAWDRVAPVLSHTKEPFAFSDDIIEKAKETISRKLTEGEIFSFKNPRASLLLPFWQLVFRQENIAQYYIISARNPSEVTASLEKRDGIDPSLGMLLWINYTFSAIQGTNGCARKFIQYKQVLDSPAESLNLLADFLEIPDHSIEQDAVDDFVSNFVDLNLRHHHTADTFNRQSSIPELARKIYKLQQDLATGRIVDASDEFEKAWQSIERHYEKLLIAFEAVHAIDKMYQENLRENSRLRSALLNQAKQGSETLENVPEADIRANTRFTQQLELAVRNSELRAMTAEKNSLLQVLASEESDRRAQELKAQIVHSTSLYNTLLSENEQLKIQNKNLGKRNAALAAENDQLPSRAELEAKITSLHASLNSIEKNYTSRVNELFENNKKSNEFWKREHALLSAKLATSEQAIKNHTALIAQYENSKSIRLTAPLRKLRSISVKLFQTSRVTQSEPRTFLNAVWQALPFENSRIRLKEFVFANSGHTFANFKSYQGWLVHKNALAKQAEDVQPLRIETPTPPTQPNTSADNSADQHPLPHQNQIWDNTSEILDLFTKEPPVLHEYIPSHILAAAKLLIANSKLSVSVIIPTWNRQDTVVPAVQSVLQQSCKVDEIIISDDGSTDNTIEVIRKEFPGELRRGLIRILENTHAGVSAARNAGMQKARGDIFAYLDSDNQWRKDYIMLMKAAFESNDEIVTGYAGLRSVDLDTGIQFARASYYDRRRLIDGNFIDLNIFSHRRLVYDQHGGFDESLNRLVDWELIIRYTKHYEPIFLPFVGVDYFLSASTLNNITHSVPLDHNREKVLQKHFIERIQKDLEDLRIAYFVYDYPARSQTFVLNEIRWLVEHGCDVNVYFHITPEDAADLDFTVDTYQVPDCDTFATLLQEHKRNICHTQFAYPGVTLFVQPACELTDTFFTFMPHAVDIFHHKNRERNKIGQIAEDKNCLRIFVYGDFHRKFLLGRGVPDAKIAYAFQAVNPEDFPVRKNFNKGDESNKVMHGIVIARYIQKKGITYLLDALSKLKEDVVSVTIYGWGPLEDQLKKQAADLQLKNVHFAGPIRGKDELAAAYRTADFLLAPCVEADDGDMDGFPTVILEAMYAGLPVVTSSVSAIDDYIRDEVEAIVVKPKDADSLAHGILRLQQMSPERRQGLVNQANSFLDNRIGTSKTMRQLLDTWTGYSLDILLVTFNVEGYDDRAETFEIISRIFARTTTWFTLTIIDNNSSPDFWNEVIDHLQGVSNVRLIRKKTNSLCGPATNAALKLCKAEFLVYICSKEGFIKSHGWDRTLVDYMRANSNVILAGYKTHLPKYTFGEEISNHPDFPKFRGQSFARENPRRVFEHVQGGIFICRRQELLDAGGFNPLLPQGNMDVELSYWLESQGHTLGSISSVSSVTTKTLPAIDKRITEETCIAHPFSLDNVSLLDDLNSKEMSRCLLCGTEDKCGESTFVFDNTGACRVCYSTPFGRSIYQLMVAHHQTHKQKTIAVLTNDHAIPSLLADRLFERVYCKSDPEQLLLALKEAPKKLDCLVFDTEEVTDPGSFLTEITEHLNLSCNIFYPVTAELEPSASTIEKALLQKDWRVVAETIPQTSKALNLDWRNIRKLTLSREDQRQLAS
ncbi:MAG: glycosyltransferase [bacterium]